MARVESSAASQPSRGSVNTAGPVVRRTVNGQPQPLVEVTLEPQTPRGDGLSRRGLADTGMSWTAGLYVRRPALAGSP